MSRKPSGGPPHAAWLEVDARRIERNMRAIRALVAPAKFMAVVKADAYGHGAVLAARAARRAGAIAVCTFGAAEAREVSTVGTPVLNLSYPFPWDVPALVDLGVEQSVWDVASAARLDKEASRRGRHVRVHIKIDTGMNRVGVPAARALELARRIRAMPGLEVAGAFTTLAERKGENESQIRLFDSTCDRMRREGIDIPLRHAATSAGLTHPAAWFDAVRVGIACYGFGKEAEGRRRGGTAPAIRLLARVIDVKRLSPGETSGYGDLFRARRPMTIAVASAGWADGLFRALSNAWRAEVRGRPVPLVGRISCNHCYLDVTGLAVEVGEPAVLLGGALNSFEAAARTIGTSIYEVTTRLPRTLARVSVGSARMGSRSRERTGRRANDRYTRRG
jgi:alanine racemase